MESESREELLARIQELEQEVADREKDLATFRAELQSANQRLEALIGEINLELKAAHKIQRLLVPTELPNIQGFEFSSKFVASMIKGGDYFDIFEHEDRARFGLIMASCSGHLMSALLLSVLIKLTGQMAARQGSSPDEMLRLIQRELQDQLQPSDQADVFYAGFDRRNYELSYCRVGEMTCLRYDYASGELKILKPQGAAIGVESQTEYKVETLTMNPRDKLILCSRGLVELTNLDDEAYGSDRLFRSIHGVVRRPVHEVRNQILFEAQKYAGGKEAPRDMTVLVAEVKDRVIKLAKS